jgi:hypothetical protein
MGRDKNVEELKSLQASNPSITKESLEVLENKLKAEGLLKGSGAARPVIIPMVLPGSGPAAAAADSVVNPDTSNPPAPSEASAVSVTPAPTVVITEEEPKKGKLAGLADKLPAWMQKKENPGANVRPNVTPGSTARPNMDKKGGVSLAKWAALILFMLIILLSIGAFVKMNATSNIERGFGVAESSDALPVPEGVESCALPDGRQGVLRYIVTPKPEAVGQLGFTDSAMTVPKC